MTNLYDTLLSDDNDIALDIINEMYDHCDFNEISKYYDFDTYNKKFSKNSNCTYLKIMHINIRSIPCNIDHLKLMLSSIEQPPDIIAVSETWLTSSNVNLYNLEGYKAFNITRNVRCHGGARNVP